MEFYLNAILHDFASELRPASTANIVLCSASVIMCDAAKLSSIVDACCHREYTANTKVKSSTFMEMINLNCTRCNAPLPAS